MLVFFRDKLLNLLAFSNMLRRHIEGIGSLEVASRILTLRRENLVLGGRVTLQHGLTALDKHLQWVRSLRYYRS